MVLEFSDTGTCVDTHPHHLPNPHQSHPNPDRKSISSSS